MVLHEQKDNKLTEAKTILSQVKGCSPGVAEELARVKPSGTQRLHFLPGSNKRTAINVWEERQAFTNQSLSNVFEEPSWEV